MGRRLILIIGIRPSIGIVLVSDVRKATLLDRSRRVGDVIIGRVQRREVEIFCPHTAKFPV